MSHGSFVSFSSLYIETWDVTFSGCSWLSSCEHFYLFSLTDDSLQTDTCECVRTCLAADMLWCVDSALCSLSVHGVTSSRLESSFLLTPWAGGTECSAQLTCASCRHGAQVSQVGPLNSQLGCCIPWTAFLGHKVNICIHMYAHIHIYNRFGGGRRDLLKTEKAGTWPISFNLNM